MAKKSNKGRVRQQSVGGVPIGRYICCGCIVFAVIVFVILYSTVRFFGGWQAMIVFFQ